MLLDDLAAQPRPQLHTLRVGFTQQTSLSQTWDETLEDVGRAYRPGEDVVVADQAMAPGHARAWDEAEALYREALAGMREDRSQYRHAFPAALNNLAYLLKKKEEYQEAEVLYTEAIDLVEKVFGKSHPRSILYRNNLAATLELGGKVDEARKQMEESIPLTAQLHGEDHWRVGRAWRSLGVLLFRNGEFADSAEAFHTSGEVFARGLGPDHLWTATSGVLEATSLYLAGEEDEADRVWRQAAVLLDTPDARVDDNVQGMIRLVHDNLPEGNRDWEARLETLMSADG